MRQSILMSVLVLCVGGTSSAFGQAADLSDMPGWTQRLALDPTTPAMQKYAQQQKARVAADKALRKLRLAYFGQIRKDTVRQEGIVKLREYTDPALFPLMVELFGKEGPDVKQAIMDHFYDSASAEGDGSLAWMAMFGSDETTKSAAKGLMNRRIAALGKVPDQVTLAVAAAIKSDERGPLMAGLELIKSLDLVQFVPWLIAGQVRQQGVQAGSGGGGDGDLAYIVVGQQTAFVSDLTPVVSQSAVGFDPQVSALTTGTLLRIHQAVVIEYNVDVNNALVELTSRHMGRSTRQLGWNVPAWRDFYANEFLPKLAEEAAAKAAAKAKATQPSPTLAPDAK